MIERTERRKSLIRTLVELQNHPAHANHDILTITGFMSDDEVLAHVASCVNQMERWYTKSPARSLFRAS